MTRIIKASEVKPGMEVEWTQAGVTRKCVAETVDSASPRYGVNLHTSEGGLVHIPGNAEVTVLSEPAPVQPEEPVTLCARIVVAGRKIYRWTEDPKEPWPWRGEALNVDPVLWSWGQLCGLGQVTIIDADPSWTLPAQVKVAPVVPERIEEWPEADEHLRKHKWRDMDGDTWTWAKAEDKWECRSRADIRMGASRRPGSWFGPFTRVTDA